MFPNLKQGTNFGADSALVLVAGHECILVDDPSTTPHSRITCVLPSGHGFDREVLLLQHRGEISRGSNAAYISYEVCCCSFANFVPIKSRCMMGFLFRANTAMRAWHICE